MKAKVSRIVVIGASAGGLDALGRLVAQLPTTFPAPILIVQHMAADATGLMLIKILTAKGRMPCKLAEDGDELQGGCIYIAPFDHHLLVEKGAVLVTKGARENRCRPAIDPLFRSAAVAYDAGVIGVLLTGYPDDGISGMVAIKRCGGLCIVQDPKDAAYPEMVQNALNNLNVDHKVQLDAMGALLVSLVKKPVQITKLPGIPEDIKVEAKIAKRGLSDVRAVDSLGDQVPFNCPACGGVLWKIAKSGLLRYRCHTGHAFTSAALLADQSAKIEETLWVALRMFEERRNLLKTLAGTEEGNAVGGGKSALEKAKDSGIHIEGIRAMLLSGDAASHEEAEEGDFEDEETA
jgi:two-component system, chemotaxis family, protein-glutamate methylesterase/glutaminase